MRAYSLNISFSTIDSRLYRCRSARRTRTSLYGSRRVLIASSGDSDRIVIEDLALLVQPALDVRVVQLLDPFLSALHEVVVDVATLEHLEFQAAVAHHCLLDLVEICRADVPAVIGRPVVVAPTHADRAAAFDVLLPDLIRPGAGRHVVVVLLEKGLTGHALEDVRRQDEQPADVRAAGEVHEVLPVLGFGANRHDVLALSDGRFEVAVNEVPRGVLERLVHRQTPGCHDVIGGDRHAVGPPRVRVDTEPEGPAVVRYLPMRGKAGDVLQRRRMQIQQALVDDLVEREVPLRDVRAVVSERRREVRHHPLPQHAALDRAWIANEVVIRVRVPSFTGKASPALGCSHGGVGAGIGVGEHGVRRFVCRSGSAVRCRRWGGPGILRRGGRSAACDRREPKDDESEEP